MRKVMIILFMSVCIFLNAQEEKSGGPLDEDQIEHILVKHYMEKHNIEIEELDDEEGLIDKYLKDYKIYKVNTDVLALGPDKEILDVIIVRRIRNEIYEEIYEFPLFDKIEIKVKNEEEAEEIGKLCVFLLLEASSHLRKLSQRFLQLDPETDEWEVDRSRDGEITVTLEGGWRGRVEFELELFFNPQGELEEVEAELRHSWKRRWWGRR
jgi:hypothetical protein